MTFLWNHGGESRCEFCTGTATADGAHSQRKGTEAPTLPTLKMNCPYRAGWYKRIMNGVDGLETRLVWTLKGHVVWPRPRTALSTTEVIDGCEKGGIEKTQTSDPHVLKQCAQRPQEVHLNTLAPAASKCASKTAGRLYFLSVFFFFCHLKNLSWDVYVPDYFSPQREIMMKEKDRF